MGLLERLMGSVMRSLLYSPGAWCKWLTFASGCSVLSVQNIVPRQREPMTSCNRLLSNVAGVWSSRNQTELLLCKLVMSADTEKGGDVSALYCSHHRIHRSNLTPEAL
jgi:hypothetical protein